MGKKKHSVWQYVTKLDNNDADSDKKGSICSCNYYNKVFSAQECTVASSDIKQLASQSQPKSNKILPLKRKFAAIDNIEKLDDHDNDSGIIVDL